LDHQYTGKFARAASGGEEDVKQEIQVDDYEPFRMYLHFIGTSLNFVCNFKLLSKLEMWANAQRDGHPAEHRWCPLFNAAKFG